MEKSHLWLHGPPAASRAEEAARATHLIVLWLLKGYLSSALTHYHQSEAHYHPGFTFITIGSSGEEKKKRGRSGDGCLLPVATMMEIVRRRKRGSSGRRWRRDFNYFFFSLSRSEDVGGRLYGRV